MKQFKILVTVFSLAVFMWIAMPSTVLAYDFLKQSGIKNTAEETGHTKITIFKNNNFVAAAASFVKIIFSFIGVIFLIYMIYGGYLWMMSAGNDQQVGKAKKIILNSAIGLVIVLSAYAITALFQQFTEKF